MIIISITQREDLHHFQHSCWLLKFWVFPTLFQTKRISAVDQQSVDSIDIGSSSRSLWPFDSWASRWMNVRSCVTAPPPPATFAVKAMMSSCWPLKKPAGLWVSSALQPHLWGPAGRHNFTRVFLSCTLAFWTLALKLDSACLFCTAERQLPRFTRWFFSSSWLHCEEDEGRKQNRIFQNSCHSFLLITKKIKILM